MSRLSPREFARYQAEKHPPIRTHDFSSLEDYCIFLMHSKAYEVAASQARGKRVLDIGCNHGYGTNIIGREAASVVGVDVSPQAVQEAKQRYGDHIEFHLVGGMALPFPDGAFDLVTSLQVIEHVVDHATYLSEIWRVLTARGRAVITTPNAAIRLDPGMRPWNRLHAREFTPAEFGELLEEHFSEVEVLGMFATEELHDIEYRRVQQGLKSARALAKLNRFLPEPAVERLHGLGKAILKRTYTPPDPVVVDRLSVADIRYESEGVERSLDLLAIAQK